MVNRHIEGKELFPNLPSIDEDLFTDLSQLTYLHIAVHNNLRTFPPLTGIPKLHTLILAVMFSIEELPPFDALGSLQQLNVIYLPSLRALPDLAPLRSLIMLTTVQVAFCCNGFLGNCSLTDTMCGGVPDLGIAATVCLADDAPRAGRATTTMISKFPNSTCLEFPPNLPAPLDVLTPESIEICGGVRFRRCELPQGSGQIGICYNKSLRVLSCVLDPHYIKLRQAQIAAQVGPACDPDEEAWLGCSK